MATDPLRDQHDVTPEPEEEEETDPTVSPAREGEEEAAGGSAPRPDSDDDVEDMVSEVTGQKPKLGMTKTFGDMVDDAERLRRGRPPKEEEEQEQPE